MDQPLSSGLATEALSNAPIGVLILDKTGHITWLNRALEELLALDGDQLVGQNESSVDPHWRSLLFSPEPTLLLEAASYMSLAVPSTITRISPICRPFARTGHG